MADQDFWEKEAIRIGRWFKENCLPCTTCGELTCNQATHAAMHQATDARFEQIEARLEALENPPPP